MKRDAARSVQLAVGNHRRHAHHLPRCDRRQRRRRERRARRTFEPMTSETSVASISPNGSTELTGRDGMNVILIFAYPKEDAADLLDASSAIGLW
jgi:hypothetical protein